MNVITRRYQCFSCGKQYNVTLWATPWEGDARWRITEAVDGSATLLITAPNPICLDPRCESKVLADMNSERVATEDGRVIVLDGCERPVLN